MEILRQMMTSPDFSYEKKLWRKGFKFVVGIDEVGRGAWAGPLVVAAVVWQPNQNFQFQISNFQIKINDSKQLRAREREEAAKWIKEKALAWDVTEIGVGVINKIGIGKATQKAMRKTVKDIIKKLGWEVGSGIGSGDESLGRKILKSPQLTPKLTTHNSPPSSSFFVLVDYFYIPYLRGLGRKNQLGIKDGDQKSISIASASILAKVHRDKLMRSLSKQSKYRKYGWGENKGYGTKQQQKAILRCGLTKHHRKEFVKTWREKKKDKCWAGDEKRRRGLADVRLGTQSNPRELISCPCLEKERKIPLRSGHIY